MSALGLIASSAGGVLLIALAVRDIFDAIFHPEGRGMLAGTTMRAVWIAFRRLGVGPRRLTLAGPLGLLTVIATWAALLVLGWALVYWPHVPDAFRFGSGVASNGGF